VSGTLRQRLLTGGLWVVVGKLFTAGSSLAIHATLSHLLPRAEFGVYAKAHSLMLVAVLLAQLGLHQAVVRLVAESMGVARSGRARAAIGMVYRYAAVGVIGVAILLLSGPGSWFARAVWNSSLLAGLMGALTAWMAAASFQIITSETFRGFQDIRLATIFGGVISGVLTLGTLLLLALVRGGAQLGVVLWISAASVAASLALGLVVLRRKMAPLDAATDLAPREVLSISLPLWLNGLTLRAATQADIWILGAVIPDDELAVYAAAAFLVVMVSQPLILVNLVVPPFIADLYAKGEVRRLERILRQTATLAGIPALVLLLAMIFLGRPILGLIYPDYIRDGAPPILALLSVGRLVNVLTGSCGVTMSMTGHQKVLLRITIITSALTVAASLLVVGRHGSLGVAGAVCGGMIVQNLAMWLETRRHTGMWTHVGFPSRDVLRSILRSGRGPQA
jgi:O-antigen/teichoic acid export membrane protein